MREKLASLTEAERRVFQLVTEGRRNKEIAHDLKVTERTVKAHRAKLMKKLGATSIVALVRLAVRLEEGRDA